MSTSAVLTKKPSVLSNFGVSQPCTAPKRPCCALRFEHIKHESDYGLEYLILEGRLHRNCMYFERNENIDLGVWRLVSPPRDHEETTQVRIQQLYVRCCACRTEGGFGLAFNRLVGFYVGVNAALHRMQT
eukprot:1266309-Pleurochrysis_carterae.AAC.1